MRKWKYVVLQIEHWFKKGNKKLGKVYEEGMQYYWGSRKEMAVQYDI